MISITEKEIGKNGLPQFFFIKSKYGSSHKYSLYCPGTIFMTGHRCYCQLKGNKVYFVALKLSNSDNDLLRLISVISDLQALNSSHFIRVYLIGHSDPISL